VPLTEKEGGEKEGEEKEGGTLIGKGNKRRREKGKGREKNDYSEHRLLRSTAQ
jgi:hypothetical protein